ncbi:MAG: rRNA adenine dimethyltransferase family protein [bacterium]|nr:rRNA adenine dimethyltransferase family protein [bacterium]
MPSKLGQNFLTNKTIVNKIIESANLGAEDLVLEIGPGKGILTEELAEVCRKVIAVEIDKNLAEMLKNKFKGNDKVEIIKNDILKINIIDLISNFPHPASEAESTLSRKERWLVGEGKLKYKLIANLPYYITSPIIRVFLESDFPPTEMILMVQKEVAERITATPGEIPTASRDAKRISRGKPGKMSILAVSAQYYAKPELLFFVDKNNFNPAPKVDSAVIKVSPFVLTSSPLGRGRGEGDKNFFRVVRAGFCAKRKTIVNNLSNSFHLDKKEVEKKLKKIGVGPNVRAQELSVEEWKKLSEIFHSSLNIGRR